MIVILDDSPTEAVSLRTGLRQSDVGVLAALSRAPRGIIANEAIAERAGVPAGQAARALTRLAGRGLIRIDREWIAAGEALEVDIVSVNVEAPGWPDLAPLLARVPLPDRPPRRVATRVPDYLRHLFWNADFEKLDPRAHGPYIAERLLSTGDLEGLAWGARSLRAADWVKAAETRGLMPQQRTLARNIAMSTAPH